MLIEIHMIKNYPPVNLNRDESGSPKTVTFGGTQRGAISSQCLKRRIRTDEMFKALDSYGIRTLKMPEEVVKIIHKKVNEGTLGEIEEGIIEEVGKKLKEFGKKDKNSDNNETSETSDNTSNSDKSSDKSKKDDLKTKQIIFYSKEDIDGIAEAVADAIRKCNGQLKAFKGMKLDTIVGNNGHKSPVTLDIALFGRMVTSDVLLNVDASMSVAGAISTHIVIRESDFYVAMDDLLKPAEETGAGMMGNTDFNSCCYYEYGCVDVDHLISNLLLNVEDGDQKKRKELAKQAIPILLKVMAYANPTGKQNSFAGHIFPDLIMIECKKDKIPLSYVNAYSNPVSISGSNPKVVENSIKRLAEHVDNMDRAYPRNIEFRGWFAPSNCDSSPINCQKFDNYNTMIDACINTTWSEDK